MVSKTWKRPLLVLLTIGILILNVSPVFADEVYLGQVPQWQQPMSNVCWATSSAMIVSGLLWDQNNRTSQIVIDKYGSYFNGSGNMYDCYDAVIKYANITGTTGSNSMSYTALQNQLRAGGPVYVGIAYTGGGGHAMAATGFNNNGSLQQVWLNDPADGDQVCYTYPALCNNAYSYWDAYAYFK